MLDLYAGLMEAWAFFLGSEYFEVLTQDVSKDHRFLYVKHSTPGGEIESQGLLRSKLMLKSLDPKKQNEQLMAVAEERSKEKQKIMVFPTNIDPEAEHQKSEQAYRDSQKAKKKLQKLQKEHGKKHGLLDNGDEDLERAFRDRKKGTNDRDEESDSSQDRNERISKAKKGKPKKKPARRSSDEEEDDDEEEDEDDDGFINDEEEESGQSDDSDSKRKNHKNKDKDKNSKSKGKDRESSEDKSSDEEEDNVVKKAPTKRRAIDSDSDN